MFKENYVTVQKLVNIEYFCTYLCNFYLWEFIRFSSL